MDRVEPFDPDSGNSFADYVDQLEFYFESVDLDLGSVFKSDPDYAPKMERVRSKRRAVLLSQCGPKCFEVLKNLAAPVSVKEFSFEELVDLAKGYFDGEDNPLEFRFKFGTRVRGESERFSTFHGDLCEIAKKCNFGLQLEERIRDQVLCGMRDEEVVEKWIKNRALSYEDIVSEGAEFDKQFKGGGWSCRKRYISLSQDINFNSCVLSHTPRSTEPSQCPVCAKQHTP